jgi:hypothetical protein
MNAYQNRIPTHLYPKIDPFFEYFQYPTSNLIYIFNINTNNDTNKIR